MTQIHRVRNEDSINHAKEMFYDSLQQVFDKSPENYMTRKFQCKIRNRIFLNRQLLQGVYVKLAMIMVLKL